MLSPFLTNAELLSPTYSISLFSDIQPFVPQSPLVCPLCPPPCLSVSKRTVFEMQTEQLPTTVWGRGRVGQEQFLMLAGKVSLGRKGERRWQSTTSARGEVGEQSACFIIPSSLMRSA